MQNYKEMTKRAREAGVAKEEAMWASIAAVNDLLEDMAVEAPEKVRKFMRKQHQLFFGCHYTKEYAEEDMEGVFYIDNKGHRHEGAYWTAEQVDEATRGLSFPSGTTKYDKWVAFNVFRADTKGKLDDETTLRTAFDYYFADDDYPGGGKIWREMTAKHCS
jgi:hypothetical protein